MWRVVNATPGPLYPRLRPCTHCIGGWVAPRAGVDECGKSPDRPAVACSCTDYAILAHNICTFLKVIQHLSNLCAFSV